MALRCFVFCSDEGTSDLIRQVLTALGVEGEVCTEATTATHKVTSEVFHLVVVDWDQQPEAGVMLSTARERKFSERPLCLAIVSDDASVSKALQAGANSILKKPLAFNQVTDTLTTARDLLRSRQESSAQAAAAGAGSASTLRAEPAPQSSLRAGEFLQAGPAVPSRQFETDSEVARFPEDQAQQVDALRDLEPVAAAVTDKAPEAPPASDDEPRGLEWHLKARGVMRPAGPMLTPPSPPAPPANAQRPELLGYDQPHSVPQKPQPPNEDQSRPAGDPDSSAREQQQEAQLFSYITGEDDDSSKRSRAGFKLRKTAIAAALVLAAAAVIATPQAPWHPKLVLLVSRGQRALHGWLNPQPVTAVTQAPTTHEDFGRAGDEYKLPVAENIPDATTDPAQINVVPVIDPTAKKPAADSAGTSPSVATPDVVSPPPSDTNQSPVPDGPANPPAQPAPDSSQPPALTTPTTQTTAPITTPHADVPAANPTSVSSPPSPVTTTAPRPQPAQYSPATTAPKVPSSLKSQMATMVPDASGNKPMDAALPSIEPVQVPELTERALLADQPPVPYPANGGGKQGTVTLQVLIGRDGTVQGAVFLQGSLVFARTAIEGVKRWKFKPYTLNGRPVQVQTNLTLKFAPNQ